MSEGKRLDGRKLNDHRNITVEMGVIEKAEGSARVFLGKTEVLVGVKVGVGEPYSDTPGAGVLTVSAELVPLASPSFEPGPPGEDAIELARVVDRGLRESKAINLEKLCLEPGKKVLIVFVDVYVLNHDGNLIDASAIAALAAVLNTKIPKYHIEEGLVTAKPGYDPLPIQNHPIAVTFSKIAGILAVDPALDEELILDARLTITTGKDGEICAMQKGGSSHFVLKEILEMATRAQKVGEEIRKLVVKK
jgi:exosome complex component RRP42